MMEGKMLKGGMYAVTPLECPKVMRLQPGDVLVVEAPDMLTQDGRNQTRDRVEEHFPGHKCIVLDGGMTLSVVGAEGEQP